MFFDANLFFELSKNVNKQLKGKTTGLRQKNSSEYCQLKLFPVFKKVFFQQNKNEIDIHILILC